MFQQRADPRSFLTSIPEFGGELHDDYYQFKAIFDKTARAAEWSDQQKSNYLPLRLRKEAADVYDHLEDYTKMTGRIWKPHLNQSSSQLT